MKRIYFPMLIVLLLLSCVDDSKRIEREKLYNTNFECCCELYKNIEFSGKVLRKINAHHSGSNAFVEIELSEEKGMEALKCCSYFFEREQSILKFRMSKDLKYKVKGGGTVIKEKGSDKVWYKDSRNQLIIYELTTYEGLNCEAWDNRNN